MILMSYMLSIGELFDKFWLANANKSFHRIYCTLNYSLNIKGKNKDGF